MRANRGRTILLAASALVAGLLLAGVRAGGSSDSRAIVRGRRRRQGGGCRRRRRRRPRTAQDATGQDTAGAGAGPQRRPALDHLPRLHVGPRRRTSTPPPRRPPASRPRPGGFVGADNRHPRLGGDDTATMELRVPADKFAAVVDQLAKTGHRGAAADQHRGRHRADRRPGRPDHGAAGPGGQRPQAAGPGQVAERPGDAGEGGGHPRSPTWPRCRPRSGTWPIWWRSPRSRSRCSARTPRRPTPANRAGRVPRRAGRRLARAAGLAGGAADRAGRRCCPG